MRYQYNAKMQIKVCNDIQKNIQQSKRASEMPHAIPMFNFHM